MFQSPVTAQYIQATRNQLQVQRAATRLVYSQPSMVATNISRANFAAYSYAHSPYRYYPYGYYPYGYWNAYSFPGYNPYWASPYVNPVYYGTPYSYGAGYGSGLNYLSAGYSAPSAPVAAPVAPTPAPRVVAAVAAHGIPTNEDGTIAWPFAFRMMAPNAKRDLLDPLAGKLEAVAAQANAGRANPNMVRDSQQGVDRLYQWLRTHRLDLAEGSVREANAFLGRIDAALRAMKTDA